MSVDKESEPYVSVIIPCYNHGQFLLEAIASAENEPLVGEVIIVNDGSTASVTLAIVEKLERESHQVFNIKNRGLSGARNFGIEQAKYPYILPLDADNRLVSGFLKKALVLLEEDSEIGVVYGDRQVFGQQNQWVEMAEFRVSRLLLGNYIDACALFRRQVWEDVGGYDSEIPDQLGYEDWDFWLGAVEAGWQFAYVNQVAFQYRSRPDSMVSGCNLPANRKRLFQYICSKHSKLYSAQFADVFSTKEAQRLDALDEAFQYSEKVSKISAELAIIQQERDQYFEKNQILKDRLQWIEEDLESTKAVGTEREDFELKLETAMSQSNYWQEEYGKVLEELNSLRQVHHQLLTSRWWRLKARIGRVIKRLDK
ncbi:MAG: glycosyltransferase family A protein [Cyanobacteria bacterium P01_C01_bin.89]